MKASSKPRTTRRRCCGLDLKLAGGFEDGDASAFGSDEGTGNVKAVFGQKFVEVVAGDAARDVGKARLHEGRVRVAQALQAGVDLAFASAAGDDRRKFLFGGSADRHSRAVVEEDVERLDVVDGLAAHQRVDSARVVSDHAAHGAAAVGCGIGGKGEVVYFRGVSQCVEDDPGLHAGEAGVGVEIEDGVHVLREVNDHRHVATLTRERCASAARKDGRSELTAGSDGGDHVFSIEGKDKSYRHLAVVRGVGGVEGARGFVEADLAANGFVQTLCKTG